VEEPSEDLVESEAAAKILGIKTITVYKWVSERKIPFIKVGGALRFRPSALQAWLRAREFSPVGSQESRTS
jgi:excisionase family DNA binding protein